MKMKVMALDPTIQKVYGVRPITERNMQGKKKKLQQGMRMAQAMKKIGVMSLVVYLMGVFYYCFAYLLRVYTGVLESHILTELNVTASGFGMVTSFYYFSYAPLQVPVGVCVDIFGQRRALLVACLVACWFGG